MEDKKVFGIPLNIEDTEEMKERVGTSLSIIGIGPLPAQVPVKGAEYVDVDIIDINEHKDILKEHQMDGVYLIVNIREEKEPSPKQKKTFPEHNNQPWKRRGKNNKV